EIEVERHPNIPHSALDEGWNRAQIDHRLAKEAVLTGVRERDRLTFDDGTVERARPFLEQTANVEYVGEVGSECEAHANVDAMVVVVLEPDPLVQAIFDDSRAPDVQRLRRDLNAAVQEIRIREVDVRHVRALGARRR